MSVTSHERLSIYFESLFVATFLMRYPWIETLHLESDDFARKTVCYRCLICHAFGLFLCCCSMAAVWWKEINTFRMRDLMFGRFWGASGTQLGDYDIPRGTGGGLFVMSEYVQDPAVRCGMALVLFLRGLLRSLSLRCRCVTLCSHC